MKFSVYFKADNQDYNISKLLYKYDGPRNGFALIDYIRKLLKSDVDSKFIRGVALEDVNMGEMEITLTESQARETGRFKDQCYEIVWLKPESFNKLPQAKIVAGQDDNGDWYLYLSLTPEDVFNEWAKAGYPLQWKIEDETA